MTNKKKPITATLISLKEGEKAVFPLKGSSSVSSIITRVQDDHDRRFSTHKNREEKTYEVTRIA